MGASENVPHAGRHPLPFASQQLKSIVTRSGERVINAAAAIDFGTAAFDETAPFQFVQGRVNGAFAERKSFVADRLDGFDHFVAVHIAPGEQLQNHQFGNAVKERRIGFLHRGGGIPSGVRHVKH
jgi:hypothetical protein